MTYINMPGDVTKTAHHTFELINQERKASGITPLKWDSKLEDLAIAHSQYMAQSGDFNHSDNPYTENIAEGGCSNANDLYDLWRISSLHHANYMNSSLRYCAIGIGYNYDYLQIGTFNITINYSKGYATFLAR